MLRIVLNSLLVAGLLAATALVSFRQGRKTAAEGTYNVPGAWRPVAALPDMHTEPGRVALDGKIYIFGGFADPELHASQRVDIYDVRASTWSRGADIPVLNTHNPAVYASGEIWLVGGYFGHHPGVATERVDIYDPSTDSWREGPPLSAPRAAAGLAAIGDTIHLVSGHDSRTTQAGDHWSLDTAAPGATWQTQAPLPYPRGQMGMVSTGGKLYVVGGQFGHDPPNRIDQSYLHVYDPSVDSWEELAPLPIPLSHNESCIVAHGGKILSIGGRSAYPRSFFSRPPMLQDDALNNVQVYDIGSNSWTQWPALPVGLLGGFAAIVDGRLFAGGGSTYLTDHPHLTLYEYTELPE